MGLRSSRIPATAQVSFLLLLMVLPTAGTWLYFVVLSGREGMQAAYVATKLVQFSLPALWAVGVIGERVRPAPPTRAGLLWGAGIGLAVVATGMVSYVAYLKGGSLLADAPAQIAAKMAGFGIDSSIKFLTLATFYSLVHSLLEEYYWRWFVFGRLREHLAVGWAVAVSSLAFMAHHVLVVGQFLHGYGPATWVLSACVAVGGVLWAAVYERTGCLYGPWISHLLVDAGIMWIGYDLWRSAS